MIKAVGKKIVIEKNEIELAFSIRKVLEFEDVIVVLMYDETVTPNNVVAFDYEGEQLWIINDILKIKKPTGNIDIEKTLENKLNVFSVLGIVYCVDVDKKELITKNNLR
ncbi:hypothetical protein [Dendrosporobacter sp. 1207_IL3150]|uniref:hypothetical protein n=1 Tax=Dendrosporobacter sp. 1207_IL3150 TaxID=3084054 RepID=UPI002FD8AC21